ncbi:MAG: ATP-dependent DNA ligase [Acidimicrobiales bacterium]|nr:ATP-dependent DNA ligase [Acidimicrobiales bacterium]
MALTLRDVAVTSTSVAATSSKKEKVTRLAALLRSAGDDELPIVVGLLAGLPRQGRIGVGWALLGSIDPPPGIEGGTRTVAEFDCLLDELAALAGEGSTTARAERLSRFLAETAPDEVELVRRLLLGGLRQGALEGLVLDALAAATDTAPAAVRRALMLAGDLAAVATIARQGEGALAGVHLVVGRPLRPMLAATSPDVATAVDELGLASVVWKLAGARVQVHRHHDQVSIFTRNLNDITARLPDVVELVRRLPGHAAVLDGELIGLNETAAEQMTPHLFQDTISRFATRRSGGDAIALSPFFFDCLHLDGTDLVDRPLHERLAALDRAVGRYAVTRVVTDDATAAARFSADALQRGHEGVMVKALDAPYAAGRRGSAWRKVKPVRTLDLVVLAAEWGHGRRQGRLSNLHLGARDPSGPDRFVMVGKTFKGLTDALLTWQTEQLLARQHSTSGITVHVRPELVVEIALDGVQRSVRYPGGVALRFARVRRYRDDKDPAEADTIATVRALLAGAGTDEVDRDGS